jgi:hypothetical protein
MPGCKNRSIVKIIVFEAESVRKPFCPYPEVLKFTNNVVISNPLPRTRVLMFIVYTIRAFILGQNLKSFKSFFGKFKKKIKYAVKSAKNLTFGEVCHRI